MAVAATGSEDKPNIVLVVMDNFGYGEIGVYGGGVCAGHQRLELTALPLRDSS